LTQVFTIWKYIFITLDNEDFSIYLDHFPFCPFYFYLSLNFIEQIAFDKGEKEIIAFPYLNNLFSFSFFLRIQKYQLKFIILTIQLGLQDFKCINILIQFNY
jgi:hypothetical protein